MLSLGACPRGVIVSIPVGGVYVAELCQQNEAFLNM